MKTTMCALFLFFSFSAIAQYPFEKHPAIKYIKVPFKVLYFEKDTSRVAIAKYGQYRFVIRDGSQRNNGDYSCKLHLYFKEKQVFVTDIDPDIFWVDEHQPLKIADINGDGLLDFKIIYPNASGSGLAGSLIWKFYLFGTHNQKFKKVVFADFNENESEYDFDGDGNYEIISKNYLSYKYHSYWIFDLYNYINGKFLNVSQRNNYPIAVRFLASKDNYDVTKKIPQSIVKTFSKKLPKFYEQGK